MRIVSAAFCALLTTAGVAGAQDVKGVLDGLNRAINPQQGEQGRQSEADRPRERSAEDERYWREYYGNQSDWRERADRDFRQRGEAPAQPRDDVNSERVFSGEAARRFEYDRLSYDDRRRYDTATPSERQRWDRRLADSARDRWEAMSPAQRDRYLDELGNERGSSGSSSERRR